MEAAGASIQHRVGQRIRLQRTERGLRQYELAQEAGLSPERLCRLERGRAMPTIVELDHLADVLGITIMELFREDDVSAA